VSHNYTPLGVLYATMPERNLHLEAARARQSATSRSISPWRRVGGILAAVLGSFAALAYDSRDGLPSKEQELAAHGFFWEPDPVQARSLAEEIQAARARRRAALTPLAPLPTVSRTELPEAA
jgi:hypothetical protein